MKARPLILLLILAPLPALSLAAAANDGATLYQQHCAQCHDTGANRAPLLEELKGKSREEILHALEGGVMKQQGAERTPQERRALANFLSGAQSSAAASAAPAATGAAAPPVPEGASPVSAGPSAGAAAIHATHNAICTFKRPRLDLSDPHWASWGYSPSNDRRASATDAGLSVTEVPKLHLKWAFGFPGVTEASVQPTVVGRWVFVGSSSGRVYALDLQEGCIYWTFDAAQDIRGAITIAPLSHAEGGGSRYAAYFADRSANVYSLNPMTGELRWKQHAGDEDSSNTGSVTVYKGRVYVPLNGGGEGEGPASANSTEGCCKTHGGVAALDADTGQRIWYSSSLQGDPQPSGKDDRGRTTYGPSGVGVWNAPTIDPKTNRLYVGSGDSHTDPAGPTSDSILAYDMSTGALVWAHQATRSDAYTGGCDRPDLKGCPAENGPDFDFGQPPVLVSLPNGKRLLVAGQKSGLVYGFDPDDKGREVWRTRVGTGGLNGGITWGVATDDKNVYVAVSDQLDVIRQDAMLNPHAGGLVALRLGDGKRVWRTTVSGCAEHQGSNQRLHPITDGSTPPDFGCSDAQKSPVTLIPGVAFSGSLDGHLRAYATNTGRVLWDFDTARDFYTVNYVSARGGSIDKGGVTVVNGMVLTTSGYSRWGGMPGNVLLAFSAEPPR